MYSCTTIVFYSRNFMVRPRVLLRSSSLLAFFFRKLEIAGSILRVRKPKGEHQHERSWLL